VLQAWAFLILSGGPGIRTPGRVVQENYFIHDQSHRSFLKATNPTHKPSLRIEVVVHYNFYLFFKLGLFNETGVY